MASRDGEPLPSDVLTQLTKTASDLASVSPSLQTTSDDDPKTSPGTNGENLERERQIKDPVLRPIDLKWYEKQGTTVPSLAHRFLTACINRALNIFSLDNPAQEWPALGFLSPLVLLELRNPGALYKLTTIHMGGLSRGYWVDAVYDSGVHESLPTTFRTIEGRSDIAIPRMSPPRLQCLEFGRTRTILRTGIRGLQGEWLEAVDVEEYLSERGISIHRGGPSDRIVLGLPSLEDEIRKFRAAAPMSIKIGEASNADHISHWEHNIGRSPSDSTVFGVNRGSFPQVPSRTLSFTPSPSQCCSLLGMQQSRVPIGDSEPSCALPLITVDIDKLISMLAVEAACLGPGPGVRRAAVDLAIRESLTIDIERRHL